ncbi:type IV toxin-antitoxin system AbiEi family antitoxin domain-containing protein [Paeniglutamicibacter sp.]|uniref:type IV toxin-antitoxin system AbiEi family antitoxin domain-containing protein n=1 Tax=Paeniglutamicibacter sp. TaxID=1934391 RepID=UPI0039895044
MKPSEALLVLSDLASAQWGLVTTQQARASGVSAAQMARFAERGNLERLQHGVYAVAGAPVDPHREIQSAWLGLNPSIPAYERIAEPEVELISHASAANLHGLGNVDADDIEFTVARRRQSRRTDIRFHRADVPRNDRTLKNGMPVTTPARTVQDLAAIGIDGGHLAPITRDAIVKAGVDMDDLAARLAPFAIRYGMKQEDGQGLVDRFLVEAGLPESSRQLTLHQLRGSTTLADGITTSAIQMMLAQQLEATGLLAAIKKTTESITASLAFPLGGHISEVRGALESIEGTPDVSQRLASFRSPVQIGAVADPARTRSLKEADAKVSEEGPGDDEGTTTKAPVLPASEGLDQ